MAAHGIVSIALDFRSAVRWAKLNARALKTRPDLVGPLGRRASVIARRVAAAWLAVRWQREELGKPANIRRNTSGWWELNINPNSIEECRTEPCKAGRRERYRSVSCGGHAKQELGRKSSKPFGLSPLQSC